MKKHIGWALVLSFVVIITAACGNQNFSGENRVSENASQSEGHAAGKLTGRTVTILTGGTPGVYFQLGNAMAKMYGEELDARASVQTTKASAENITKISQKKAELGFATADTVTDAYRGEGNFAKDGVISNIRAVASLYPNYMQIVAPKSAKVRTLQDLKGKDIAVGELGSGTEIMARHILTAAGIRYDGINANYLSFSEGIEGIKNGTIDAAFLSSGYPNLGIMELAATDEVVIIPVPKELTEELKKKYPAFDIGIIPASTYKGVNEDRETLMVNSLLITNKDMQEEEVYELTKALFDNLEDLRHAHSSAEKIELEKAVQKLPLPLHPGAEKYYKEKGILK
ncbi:TAXI family TRAP transporter solute-binding subunit [Domibacillus indicus]|uniref:TAXI family TRAP transporter solute-binding subunit n=1 Tax=Domibacillus indicus TaxID=1437523 RepID=UPI00203B7D49|nr:TAXI family TRAP transporter solute-binding subunit [Domibacillus indicus]MCM3790540.1 TAXI family TRAP transporter solute-binding subunit [Domibacillus indicus]